MLPKPAMEGWRKNWFVSNRWASIHQITICTYNPFKQLVPISRPLTRLIGVAIIYPVCNIVYQSSIIVGVYITYSRTHAHCVFTVSDKSRLQQLGQYSGVHYVAIRKNFLSLRNQNVYKYIYIRRCRLTDDDETHCRGHLSKIIIYLQTIAENKRRIKWNAVSMRDGYSVNVIIMLRSIRKCLWNGTTLGGKLNNMLIPSKLEACQLYTYVQALCWTKLSLQ